MAEGDGQQSNRRGSSGGDQGPGVTASPSGTTSGMTSTHAVTSPGVSLADHNGLKYSIGVTRVGQVVMATVFGWGYVGSQDPIKTSLFAMMGYNNTRYRKDFNGSQRAKIDANSSPPSVADFDITLIYKILQMLCGLQNASSPDWVTATSDSLEYYLYAIKTKRNDVAHENLKMGPQDLEAKMMELTDLFKIAIQKAGEQYGIHSSQVDGVKDSVVRQLSGIKDSPVPPATVVEYERERRALERACILEECWEELAHLSSYVSLVDIAGYKVNVSCVFTGLKLKRDETHILQRQLTVSESYVDVSEVLRAKECDGTEPQIVLLSSLTGMGKSTLLKYLVERSCSDKSVIKGLDDFDAVLYLNCNNTVIRSLVKFLALLLPRTSTKYQAADFQQHILSLNLLVLLDDAEGLDNKSLGVVEEFCRAMSAPSRVVATASREKSKEIQQRLMRQHKLVLYLEIEGISDELTVSYIKKVIHHGMRNSILEDESEQMLYNLITSKRPFLQDHLRSPEVLTAISICWTFYPDRINTSTTVTEIFLLIQDVIKDKVLQNIARSLPPSMITRALVKSKLTKFLETLSAVAVNCLVKGNCNVDQKDLMTLVKKRRKLELEEESLICTFLNYNGSEGESALVSSRQVSFPQKSTMHYYAAIFLMRHCERRTTGILDVLEIRPQDVSEHHSANFQAVLRYLLGLLTVHMPQRLRERAGEIVSLLKIAGIKKASQWLQYIDEAKQEPTITQQILNEMGDEWEVEDYAISSTLVNIMTKRLPRRLTVTVCESPSNFYHLSKVLEVCSEAPDLTLSLHLYKQFWSEKVEVSDKYLDMVGGKSCQLEHFAGRLSATAIPHLPSNLHRLALQVTPEMMSALNDKLDTMVDLQMLYLNLDVNPRAPLDALPRLRMPGKNTLLSVDIWKVTQDSIDWACDAALSLSASYSRLVLRQSELDEDGARVWLEGLGERRVVAPWVVVGSTHTMDDVGLQRLQQCALTTVNCTKFVWLKV